MTYFVYTIEDGFINCKLPTQTEAQQLADANGETHAILEAPSDHDTVNYAYVVDGAAQVATATQINNQALDEFREERNQKLAASDWTQANDSPLSASVKTSYQQYRQILRDMPQESGFDPLNPEWPTVP